MLYSVGVLILSCLLTVTGFGELRSYEEFIWVETPRYLSFALGGIAFAREDNIEHEYLHLQQEKLLKKMYLPLIGGGSLIANVLHMNGLLPDYRSFPTEQWADFLAPGYRYDLR